ncbi:MAG: hypothetical protein ACTSRS_08860 [Candidatus Helarchaeota archaeon]
MSLWDLLLQNPTTIVAYSIFFILLGSTLPFIGYIGKKFPSLRAETNLRIAKIIGILAAFGIVFTVGICFSFVFLKLEGISFEFFAFVAFVIPLILGPLIFLPFYLTRSKGDHVLSVCRAAGRTVNNRAASELVIVYAAFGVIASNFHDILWCGEKTNWFTTTGYLGYELDIWVRTVGANTYDYVFFGFFMLLHVIFCGCLATFMLWRYSRRFGHNLFQNKSSRKAFCLAWVGALLWGYGLYIMDKSSLYFSKGMATIVWNVGTFLWIPLGMVLLGLSAKYLVVFEETHDV